MTNDLDSLCIWFYCECKKAQLPHYKNDKCNGYNHPECFAYLTVGILEERTKDYNLNKAMENK